MHVICVQIYYNTAIWNIFSVLQVVNMFYCLGGKARNKIDNGIVI